MASPARQAEADAYEEVYVWALTQLGIGAIQDAFGAWDDMMPKGAVPKSYQAWLNTVKGLIELRRAWMKSLAVEYYRLVRALRTGRTVHIPGYSDNVSVDELRDNFEETVTAIANGRRPGMLTPGEASDPIATEPEPSVPDSFWNIDPVPTDELDLDIDDLLSEIDEKANTQMEEILTTLGPEAYAKALRKAEDEDDDEADEDAWRNSRARQAAEAERITLLAARGMTYNIAQADRLAMGWVRYSKTGDPCGYCALLISRGPVYKSHDSAMKLSETSPSVLNDDAAVGDKFHTNCHCTAVPVFSREQYKNSDLFDLNRSLRKLWDEQFKGKYGHWRERQRAWMRYFRKEYHADSMAA